jgi:acyl-coenzyme A synthetase/AMP-(fatty) acid ligase
LTDTPLAAARAFLDRPAIFAHSHAWTWREVHCAAIELAQRIPTSAVVCNLCESRLGFLVAWVAALRRGCQQILPPSGGRAELLEILKMSAQTVLVVDGSAAEEAWSDHAACIRYEPTRSSTCHPDSALAWLRPEDLDLPLVRLYTSGSTGAPEPQTKTLGQLVRGALVLSARLDEIIEGGAHALGQIVCSVPPQHMFGLETSVMLPLVTGLPVLDRRPLLPADVLAAFSEAASPKGAWIATPLHLRALALSGLAIPQCGLALASTMPLSQELAMQAESLTGAPVLEIYGSTETGALAMRRPAADVAWRPVEGVRLEPGEAGTRVWGSHFPSPAVLADQVEWKGERFMLLGRQGDLIKIAGRRASLAHLNRVLEKLPGLTNGVFHLPSSESATQRLVLFHEGEPLNRAATHKWLRKHIDPVFLPRAIIQVDRLPRTATGKLQRRALDDLYAAHQHAEQAR